MILDEAIKHAEEVAEEKSNLAARIRDNMKSEIALSNATECETCADEYRQLAEWLKDYKRLKEQEPCDDCVSRQAIDQNIYDYAESNGLSYVNMKNYILDVPSVTPTQRWTPVSGELPKEPIYKEFIEPSEPVLVQLTSGEMRVSRYWGSRERYKDEPWIDLSFPMEVVAWMPLPEPYKVESEVENDGFDR